MDNQYERQQYLEIFESQNGALMDKTNAIECAIPEMKAWCVHHLKMVRQSSNASAVRKVERDVELMVRKIEEVENSIFSLLNLMHNEFVRAEEAFDFFDPESVEMWLNMRRDFMDHQEVMDEHILRFEVVQNEFVDFQARIKYECSRILETS